VTEVGASLGAAVGVGESASGTGASTSPATAKDSSRRGGDRSGEKKDAARAEPRLVNSPESDTLRGRVEVLWSAHGQSVILRGEVPGGEWRTPLLHADTALLGALQGLEVMVEGAHAVRQGASAMARHFVARRVVVRGSDGVPARDGLVEAVAGSYRLRLTEGGTVDVPHLPASLRSMAGARVYLLGPLDAPPVGYGILVAPPAGRAPGPND